MDFDALLSHILRLLQGEGRVSYGALKRRFHLDDDYLEDLKHELIDAKQWAVDEGGKVLVWTGGLPPASAPVAEIPHDVSSDPASALPQTVPAAERRQLTVMFCDLKDSTSLAEQLDVEDYRDVIYSQR